MSNSIEETANHERRIKLTKRSVESLAPAAAPVVHYDDKLAGFGVRVMPSGRRSYFVQYRNKHHRSRWFTIGAHGKVTADAARMMAQRILQTVAVDGRDPSGEREAFRAAPTVSDLLDRYITEHVEPRNRPATRAAFKAIVERDIRPELGRLKVASVTRQDMHRSTRRRRLSAIQNWVSPPRRGDTPMRKGGPLALSTGTIPPKARSSVR